MYIQIWNPETQDFVRFLFPKVMLKKHSIFLQAILAIPSAKEGDGTEQNPIWLVDMPYEGFKAFEKWIYKTYVP
jgi:hypothetical protein